jgi:hypothetical protein
MNEDDFVALSGPVSLKDLMREAEDFCYKHDLEYDERKIMITTNYDSNVVIFYQDNKKN